MDKNLVAIIVLGGVALLLLNKKCDCKKNLVDEIEVDSAIPSFGRPVVLRRFQNYVDVKENKFFEPSKGAFFK